MHRGTNLPAVGSFNQSVILELIRRAPEGISRAEIAVRTGLVPQTVSNAAKQLLAQGLVMEAGTVIQGPGKPPVLLRLDPQSRFAIGVHIDPGFITYVLLDLRGQILARSMHRTPSATDPKAVIAEIAEQVDSLAKAAGIDRDRILGIGLATPGPVDAARGVMVDPPLMLGWWNVPIRDAVAAATGLDVMFDKEVIAAAAAEIWFGEPSRRDFALVYLSAGIGTGLVLDGTIRRGATGNAGDGGRIIVNDSGVPDAPSQQLGHLVTPEYLVQQAVREGILPADADVETGFERLLTEAEQGRPSALAVLERAGRNLASAVLTLVNILDIPEVVFAGPYWPRLRPLVLPTIAYVVQTSPIRSTRHEIRFGLSRVGVEVGAVGAACLVLDTVLSPRPSSLLITDRIA
ncbi:transcriptional regulator [Kaistia sp. 32K]|uniref:ROK family transcriptional regulator n=1 Tax=Kaistia sp. 32K TaxID=2795690 RepID=UPI00191500C1|nr:ROK family transcriptional regulator [Kaistia sp. 32K]BCP55193.1 transcriptional regulator [Kaistia sp. 32K]